MQRFVFHGPSPHTTGGYLVVCSNCHMVLTDVKGNELVDARLPCPILPGSLGTWAPVATECACDMRNVMSTDHDPNCPIRNQRSIK